MPDARFPTAERFSVVECARCGLGFVNPRPDRREMAAYYPAEYYDSLLPANHQRRFLRQAEYLAEPERQTRTPRLLDVGCANGDFPRFMAARGWDVAGVEVSATTRPISDFPVYTTEFSEAAIAPSSFDAVTAWAVLEHVHDPRAYFLKASEVLRPGGSFVFLVTNFAATSSKRLFREDVPRHTYFFSAPVVRRYLADAGLELVRADHGRTIFEMRPVNWLRYFLVHRLWGRPMTWDDLPETPEAYCTRLGARRAPLSLLAYAATHPFTTLDRALMPIYERATIRRCAYGIVTFVARKPDAV